MKKFSLVFLVISILFIYSGCKKDNPKKVVAAFKPNTYSPAVNEVVSFTNESQNAEYFQWDFGDGNISVDENPTHSYLFAGIFKVILKAIGSNDSDTISSFLSVEVPADMITIYEGIGIHELTMVDDTWKTMKDSFPSLDTLYHSQYLADYNAYLNQVYYEAKGIVGVFISEGDTISDYDPLIGLILLPPYPGFTTKNISIGSNLASVKYSYGEPDSIDDTDNYYGYLYESKGIDFYAYKNISKNIVTEIDLYPTQKKGAFIDFRPYIRSAFRP